MELSELGMDAWLAPSISELAALDLCAARVTAVDRGRYLVRNEAGEVPAELTGKLLHLVESSADLPCVGDWGACVCAMAARRRASTRCCRGARSCGARQRAATLNSR